MFDSFTHVDKLVLLDVWDAARESGCWSERGLCALLVLPDGRQEQYTIPWETIAYIGALKREARRDWGTFERELERDMREVEREGFDPEVFHSERVRNHRRRLVGLPP